MNRLTKKKTRTERTIVCSDRPVTFELLLRVPPLTFCERETAVLLEDAAASDVIGRPQPHIRVCADVPARDRNLLEVLDFNKIKYL